MITQGVVDGWLNSLFTVHNVLHMCIARMLAQEDSFVSSYSGYILSNECLKTRCDLEARVKFYNVEFIWFKVNLSH